MNNRRSLRGSVARVFEDVNLRSSFPLALVGADVVETTEDLEGGVTLNTVGLAEIGLLSAVDLDELDALLLQCSGSLLVLGGERLAVTAVENDELALKCTIDRMRGLGLDHLPPRGVELGQDDVVTLDKLVEGVLLQDANIGLGNSNCCGAERQEEVLKGRHDFRKSKGSSKS